MELTKRKRKLQKNRNKNNNIRELTNKERLLITLLTIIILFWISFNYVIEPQLLKINTLKTEIDDYTFKIEENNRMLKNHDVIVGERDILSFEKTNMEKDFFKSLSQPEIIYILNELLLGSNIETESINFTKPFIETLNGKEIEKMDIVIPFKGDFKALNEIIKEIEKEPRKMIINSLDLEKDVETEIIGNINLGVYSLSRLMNIENDDITIEITDDNKLNPFVPYKGYIDSNEIIEENVEESEGQVLDKQDMPENIEEDKLVKKEKYDIYKAVKGDNISYITRRVYGTESHVDEILKLNDMKRSSILPIGKELKLIKK